jgi:hypothetical protein
MDLSPPDLQTPRGLPSECCLRMRARLAGLHFFPTRRVSVQRPVLVVRRCTCARGSYIAGSQAGAFDASQLIRSGYPIDRLT